MPLETELAATWSRVVTELDEIPIRIAYVQRGAVTASSEARTRSTLDHKTAAVPKFFKVDGLDHQTEMVKVLSSPGRREEIDDRRVVYPDGGKPDFAASPFVHPEWLKTQISTVESEGPLDVGHIEDDVVQVGDADLDHSRPPFQLSRDQPWRSDDKRSS